jgi:hypothetical protein
MCQSNLPGGEARHGTSRRLILRMAAASHIRSSACDRPPASAMLCLIPGKVCLAHGWSTASERPFLACFPACHHQLQRLRPSADPAVPSSPPNAPKIHALPPQSRNVSSIIRLRKNISDGPSGRSWRLYCTEITFSKSPMYMAFPTANDLADRAVGPLNPLPCQAWARLRGFQRPPRGGEGIPTGMRALPLRGRRRCAAGGRHKETII